MNRETEMTPGGGLSRRAFLVQTGAAAALLKGGLRVPLAFAQEPVPGKERLVVRSERPLNLETPLRELTSWLTPTDRFFVRNNYDAPALDATQWTLQVEGEVDRPLTLRLDDLKKLEPVTQVVTLECAGNGRGFHTPKASGIQWERGAVGTARWGGVRLADILRMAGVRPAGRHVALDGADKPPSPAAPDFIRSVPIWKALEPHTMVAFEMNGQPLPPLHGFPARVVVPGWIGSASVKWITHIRVIRDEFDGPFMKRSYRAPRAEDEKETYSLQSLDVKSVILQPADGQQVPAGSVTVAGWAWAGEGELAGVDVSTDGGQSWKPGRLVGEAHRYAWRGWEYAWEAKAGQQTVMARGTDSYGRIQPPQPKWNPLGYRWNVIHAVRVTVG